MIASIYILIAIFLWSSLGVFVRLTGVKIHELIFYSNLVSVIIQVIIILSLKYYKSFPALKDVIVIFVLGCLSLLNTFSYFYAFVKTTIANSVLTHYTAPIFVAIISPIVLKEKASLKLLIVIIIATVGLLIMLGGFSVDKRHLPGIVSGLVSGVAYGVLIVMIRMFAKEINPLIMAFLINISIILILSPFIDRFPINALWSFIIIGVVHSTIAPIIYYKGMKYVTANKAAVLGYLEPFCAIILSYLFLKEKLQLNTLIGGALIVLSGYITLRSDKND